MIETLGFKMVGEFQDIIIKGDWPVNLFDLAYWLDVPDIIDWIEVRPWNKNLVVNGFENLVSGLLKGDKSFNLRNGGFVWHAIGSGNPGWPATPPSPTGVETALEAEYFRKKIAISWKYYMTEDNSTTDSLAPDASKLVDSTRTETLSTELLGLSVKITSGACSGEERIITGYVESTHTIYVHDAFSAPIASGITYIIYKKSATVTNIIMIETPFEATDTGANGIITEQAIYGGDCSATLDSGIMINCMRHQAIVKDDFTGFIRRIRFTFTMV